MSLEETAKNIETMSIRGAGKIARAAASALRELAESHQAEDAGAYRAALVEGGRRLCDTRPTAISLANAVRWTLRGLDGAGTVEEMRAGVVERADSFIRSSGEAVERIAQFASGLIPAGATVLTHCNSSVAVAAMVRAHEQGKGISVLSTETRPKRQGLITSRQLAKAGVPVTLIADTAVRFFMPTVNVVVVGADTVTSAGNVINKIGTSQVALCAREARVPVVVCAETYKFSPGSLHGDFVRIERREASEIIDPAEVEGASIDNPVFDETPAGYVDYLVCERGIVPPQHAPMIIERMIEE